jgi:protein involved in polysaccharide export with SLBB domain
MKTLLALIAAIAAFILAPAAQAQLVLAANHSIQIDLKAPADDSTTVSGTYTISAQGTLRLPYLNVEIRAAGITHTELARRIEVAYRQAEIYTNPAILVQQKDKPSIIDNVVNVSGEVGSKGREVPLRDGMRLLAAISAAGGFTEFSDPRRVRLIRGNRETEYDMRRINPDGSNNPVLQPNDLIIVPTD